ncbi:hypothetical protein BDA96_07G189800 [Sorghum bicolor]|uniref:Uncharacterized protein n=1 Tax=Sorghum bicolor TaxID=4558 RepID=A0A921QNZ4_SORBI|nr:hypothetical protein BDA96_07G189800 [Sorghum bicolor]
MVSAFHFAACLPLDLVIRLSIATSLCNFLSPLKLAVAAGLLSKKFIFSVTLTEHSYTSRSRRQYLIKSILDRPDRHTSSLNIVTSAAAAQIVPVPVTSSIQPASSLGTPEYAA